MQYALGRRPKGVQTWDFSVAGDIVRSKLEALNSQEDKSDIKFLQDAYLGVLNSFPDSDYKEVTFEILHDYCGCHVVSLLGSLILINDLRIQLYSLVRDISNYVNNFFVIRFCLPVLVGSLIMNLKLFFVSCHLSTSSRTTVSASFTY